MGWVKKERLLNLVNLEMLIILGGLARVDILNEMAQEVDLATWIVQQHARIIGQGAETVGCHHHRQVGRVHACDTGDASGGKGLEKTQEVTQRQKIQAGQEFNQWDAFFTWVWRRKELHKKC